MAEELTPERRIEIQTLLQELSDYWYDHPELRFGQIVDNICPADKDPYYLTDAFVTVALAAENKLTAFGADIKAGK